MLQGPDGIADVYYPNVSFFSPPQGCLEKKDIYLVYILQVHFPERNFMEV